MSTMSAHSMRRLFVDQYNAQKVRPRCVRCRVSKLPRGLYANVTRHDGLDRLSIEAIVKCRRAVALRGAGRKVCLEGVICPCFGT